MASKWDWIQNQTALGSDPGPASCVGKARSDPGPQFPTCTMGVARAALTLGDGQQNQSDSICPQSAWPLQAFGIAASS